MSDEPSPITVPAGIPALEAATEAPHLSQPQVLIITGMSGAGRTRAAAVLEDLDWYVIDNLPAQMLTHLVGMLTSGPAGARRAAARRRRSTSAAGSSSATSTPVLAGLRESGRRVPDPVPRRVRRGAGPPVRAGPPPAPAAGRRAGSSTASRRSARSSRTCASGPTLLIDTSELNVHDLAREVRAVVASGAEDALRIYVVSFGFKYGHPARRRPRGRHAVPGQPLLDHRAAAPDGPRRARARLRARPARRRHVHRPLRRRAGAGAGGVPQRGEALRDDRRRLHGRQAPLGRDQRGDRRAAAGPGSARGRVAPATSARNEPARARVRPVVALGGGHGLSAIAVGAAPDDRPDHGGRHRRRRRRVVRPAARRARRAAAGGPADGARGPVRRLRLGPDLARRCSSTGSAPRATWTSTPWATC